MSHSTSLSRASIEILGTYPAMSGISAFLQQPNQQQTVRVIFPTVAKIAQLSALHALQRKAAELNVARLQAEQDTLLNALA